MTRRRRFAAAPLVAMAAWLLGVGAAAAHPLGNATVSRALAVEVGLDQVRVVTIVDMAEIPAFGAIQEIDTDDDGAVEISERHTWAVARCERDRQGIRVRWDGHSLELRVSAEPALSFPDGLGGLETLRLQCSLTAVALADAGDVHRIEAGMADDDRPGWREVTISAGRGMEILDADVSAVSPSQALTVYPEDLLAAPLDVIAGSALVSAADSMGQSGANAAPAPTSSDRPAPGDALVAILTQPAGTGGPLGGLLGLMFSAGLGAVHGLSPGHGKALVAASLVGSRGSARQAIGLALVVAASHTGGVLVLGAVVLWAGDAIAPDRLLAWLSLAAGACVVAVGASLVLRAAAALGGRTGPEHAQGHAHGRGHEHHQAHDHGHADSPHAHGPAAGLTSRGIVGLGLFGGLVPSTSAIIALLLAVTTGQVVVGIALIVAFGLGMAVILAGIALGSVVLGRRLSVVAARPGLARLIAAVPVASGGAVLIAGTAMTVGALSQVL